MKKNYEQAHSIVAVVCDYLDIPVPYFWQNLKCRKRNLVQARQFVMYFILKILKASSSDAGSFVGKDHATCLHSVNQVNNWCYSDPEYRELFGKIERQVFRALSEEKLELINHTEK
jgi:chromosomal replication initiation ATPase DnaA